MSPKKKIEKSTEVKETEIKVIAKVAREGAEDEAEEEPLKEEIDEEELPTKP
jgi:hypothetical protein